MATASGNNPKQDTPEDIVSTFSSCSQNEPSSILSDADQQAAADKVALYHPRDNDDSTKPILSSTYHSIVTHSVGDLGASLSTLPSRPPETRHLARVDSPDKMFPKYWADPKRLMNLDHPTAGHAFCEFNLIFEPMEETNQYKLLPVGSRYPTILDLVLPTSNADGHRIVKFESHNDVDFPSLNLLQTDAALARIITTSFGSEHIDKVIHGREDITDLASDGSTNVQKLLFAF